MIRALTILALAGTALAQESPRVTHPKTGESFILNPAFPARPADQARPKIDVVFVLDTTGSMGGLIEAAKLKIWSIANTMVTAQPRPEIRLGLVGYRDLGDEYTTRLTALTDDLDLIYKDLMAFQANGGGDEPESVNQALNEAVTGFEWAAGNDTLRIVYLVGDAPPHMDYEQDVKYDASCRLAAERGIIVNTIQCGGIESTTPIWQDIARKAEGEYFRIEGNGSVVAIATPYDEELNRLSLELDKTLIPYGDARAQQELHDKIAASTTIAGAAPASAAAERAEYKCSDAGVATLCGRQELVQDCKEGKVDLASLKDEELPEDMRAMTLEQRKRHIAEKTARREGVAGQMAELATKRQSYIKDQVAALGHDKDTFDSLVYEALCRQAAKKGIVYHEPK